MSTAGKTASVAPGGAPASKGKPQKKKVKKNVATGIAHIQSTFNNTVVASPRILIPILENYQNADGSVTVPDALRPHLGGRERIE